MDQSELSVYLTLSNLRIKINGLLHLSIKLEDLIGIQSWIVSDSKYCIEYYTRGSKILCEYDNKKIWKYILEGIENIEII